MHYIYSRFLGIILEVNLQIQNLSKPNVVSLAHASELACDTQQRAGKSLAWQIIHRFLVLLHMHWEA